MGSYKRSHEGFCGHQWKRILTGVQMLQKRGLLVDMQENALDILIVLLGKGYSAMYVKICSVEGVWGLEHSPIWSLIPFSYFHFKISAWWEFSDGHPVLHGKPDFVRFPSPLWSDAGVWLWTTWNTPRERYMLCKLGHQDTCLDPERLNSKPTEVGTAGEGRHRKHWPEGTQGEEAAWESGDYQVWEEASGTDDGKITQEEKQTENNSKKQECKNRNPARAFNRSNMATSTREITSAAGFCTDQGQRRSKPVMGNARDNQDTPSFLPLCA